MCQLIRCAGLQARCRAAPSRKFARQAVLRLLAPTSTHRDIFPPCLLSCTPQVGEAVHAIVHMQPLPVSPAGSPHAGARPLAASPTAASRPPGWRVLEQQIWASPMGSPGSSTQGSQQEHAEQEQQQRRESEQGQDEPPGMASASEGQQSPFETAGSEASTWESSSSTSGHEVTVQPPHQPHCDADISPQAVEHPQLTVPPPPRPPPSPSAAQRPQQQGAPSAPPGTPEQGGTGSRGGRTAGGARSSPSSPATPALAIPQARPWQQQARQLLPNAAPYQHSTAEEAGQRGAPYWQQPLPLQLLYPAEEHPPQRRSRLAVSATALLEAATEPEAAPLAPGPPGLTHHASRSASETTGSAGGVPRTASANEPQLTEIRGPWPPAHQGLGQPSQPWRSPLRPGSGGSSGGQSSGLQLRSAFQQPQGGQGSCWRQQDDGSWYTPGGEVDWGEGEEASSAHGALSSAAAQALIGSPLVGAASHSPPLSPISTQLLLPGPQRQLSGGGGGGPHGAPCGMQRQPSAPLQRGPQRAESLSHALPDFQRQPSPLSPTWAALHAPSSPALGSPSGGGQPGGLARCSGGLSASLLQEPSLRANLLPVLNASPDVSPSGGLPAPVTPFLAPTQAMRVQSPDMGAGAGATDAGAGSSGGSGGFRDVGGLPTELLEKREHARRRAEALAWEARDTGGRPMGAVGLHGPSSARP